MELNERLVYFGVLEEFEEAIRQKDKNTAIALLRKVQFDSQMAVFLVDDLLNVKN